MKTNSYQELKALHQEEVNNFPMEFAFSDKQFNEGIVKLGLTPSDTDQVYFIGGCGFIKKTDAQEFHNMGSRHAEEMRQAIEADITGNNFIYDMFNYELANHEYGYTGSVSQTLDALSMTYEEIEADQRLLIALQKACEYQMEQDY